MELLIRISVSGLCSLAGALLYCNLIPGKESVELITATAATTFVICLSILAIGRLLEEGF